MTLVYTENSVKTLSELFVVFKLWVNKAENREFQVTFDKIKHTDFNKITEIFNRKHGEIHLSFYSN